MTYCVCRRWFKVSLDIGCDAQLVTVQSYLVQVGVDISLTLGVRAVVSNAPSHSIQYASCPHYVPGRYYDIHSGVKWTNSSVKTSCINRWNTETLNYLVKSDMSTIIPHISLAIRTILFSLSSHLLTSASNLRKPIQYSNHLKTLY